MEKNPNYWNKGLPYLDGIEFYHALPFSPELGSALLSGRVDYARIARSGDSLRKAKATQGMSGTDFYQSVIQATWMNNKKKPFDDPRVRRAFHLVLDKPVLVDVVKDVAPMMVGGFIYPFSEFATPKDRADKRLGYQADPTAAIKEAKALMAAAGHEKGIKGLDFLVRDVATLQAVGAGHPGHAAADAERRRPTCAPSWNRCGSTTCNTGNFDLAIGAIVSTLLDPVGLLQRLVQEGRAAELLALGQCRSSTRCCRRSTARSIPSKRLALIRQAEDDHGGGSAAAADLAGRRSTTSGTTT